ncbi:MAG: site-specific integrase [Planctomycetes bacterium]|nr:site-specific integrase [Planctomycetota bacterium]
MARIYRRSYRCKKTGQLKYVKGYTLEYKGADGQLVKDSTKIVRKPLAERALQKRLRAVQRQLAGEPVDDGPNGNGHITLEELADQYVRACRLRLKPSTCDMYEERLGYSTRKLGITYPNEVSLSMVDDYAGKRLGDGRATRTPNLEISVLRRMLGWAVQRELIRDNPLRRWKPLKDQPKRRRRAMRSDEVQKLLKVAPKWRRMLYMVMLASGIRKSEARQLRIADLDTERNLLRVRPEIAKTGRGRTIPLPPTLVAIVVSWLRKDLRCRSERQAACLGNLRNRLATHEQQGNGDTSAAESLREHEERVLESVNHDFLFVNGRGLPLRCNMLRSFRTDLLNAGVAPEGLDLHSLRYTANTSMVASGLNSQIVRARMGHASSAMTDLYTDDKLIGENRDTSAAAALLGLPHDDMSDEPQNGRPAKPVAQTLDSEEPLHPTPEILAELADRYTNGLIGRICDASEGAIRKWLRDAGIKRKGRRRRIGDLPEWQIALLRADLRKAIEG